MAGNFLDTLSAEEKQRIKDRTETLIELLEKWARQHPSIRPTRIPATALTTAAVLPEMSVLDALMTAQIILWIFGVDDQIDEGMISPAEARRKAKQWYSIANRGSSDEMDDSDDLAIILLEIRRRLSEFYLFEPLREYWASRLRLLVEAMAQEYQYGLQYSACGVRTLPSLDEYLHVGTRSIGFPLWGSTIMILLQDPSVVEYFEPISVAMVHMCTALRLYNDVATFDKEIQAHEVNSVVIMYHAMFDSNPNAGQENILLEAKQRILQLADSHAQRCYDLARQPKTDSGQFEQISSRVVAFHAHFYGRIEHDYHTTSQAETYELLV